MFIFASPFFKLSCQNKNTRGFLLRQTENLQEFARISMKMIQEERPMMLESSDSSDDESSDQEELELEQENGADLPEKFDLSKIKQRIEEGPASSSDEEEDESEEENLEESDDEEELENLESGGEDNAGLSGWADAMSKVLNTGKNSELKGNFLLAKAKKDQNVAESEKKSHEKASVKVTKWKKTLF